MRKIFLTVFVFALCIQVIAQDAMHRDDQLNTITTSVPFLIIGPDSRSGGMGDVGVASSPDANSIHWNPAKYAFVKDDMGIAINYVPWLRNLVPDISLAYLSGYFKRNDNETIGFSLRYFSLGDITFTNNNGDEIGQYNPNEFAISGAYARKLSDYFSIAIATRYIRSDLTGGQTLTGSGNMSTHAGQSIAADISGYFNKEVRIVKKDFDWAIGLNISNLGNKISYTETAIRDFIPINMRFGTSIGTDFDDYNKMLIEFDVNKLLVPTPPSRDPETGEINGGMDPDVSVVNGVFQSFWDAPGGSKEEFREINYSTGLEYWYNEQFAVRAGYFYEHPTKGARQFFTMGAGVKYSVFVLDFSYLIDASSSINGSNPLANTLRFSMTWNLGEIANSN
ncbi:MAG TPA: type IX secretion system outer membrane channel protein PorV [Flavobacteriales bacterium]|nr:type IX secretion system outer membrane channel protein PorV [Flavobacteriales bacterium]